MMAINIPKSHQVDVLIAGAGPSGLMTALLLARAGVTNIAIVDRTPVPVQIGHASGLQPRTREILATMGIEHDFAVHSGEIAEAAFWDSSGEKEGIKRSFAMGEVIHATAFPFILVQHQGRTEEILNAELEKRGIKVRRPCEFLDYEYVDHDEYPMLVYVKAMTKGAVEHYRCKFVVGAGGVHSGIQELAGIESSVHKTDHAWLVADAEIDSDFPDIRRRCAVRTKQGNLMLIPSIDTTVRVYMLLVDEDVAELNQSKLESGKYDRPLMHGRTSLLDIYRRRLPEIMKPYHLEITGVDWISKYSVTQRVLERFSDGKHLLFVGDSCHSHSPQAGQGMNTGMQDAYNLAWKLALVVRGRAKISLLDTYSLERQIIAHQLIDFDEKFSKLFSESEQASFAEFLDTWQSAKGFTSGLRHEYPEGPLVKSLESSVNISKDAPGPLTPGMRFLPMALIRHIDGCAVNSLYTTLANGQFHEIVFAGDISKEPRKSEFSKFYTSLISAQSALSEFNGQPPNGAGGWDLEGVYTNSDLSNNQKSTKVLNLYVVHTADHMEIDLRPEFELWKYNFFEDKNHVEHTSHGISLEAPITVAIVRPDGIVGMVAAGDGDFGKHVDAYFGAFLNKLH